MAQQQQQNPKALINQFYQRAKAEQPRYEFEAAPVDGQPNRFICTLTLPAVTIDGDSLPEQVFQEEGRSKKVAQDAVAAEAFRFLSEQPLYGSAKPYEESLLRTLATRVLSPQGLFRDPEIHGAAAAAVAYLDGWLPLAALPHSRILRGWAKEYGTSYGVNLATDPAALVEVVRRELAAQAAQRVEPAAAAADAMEGVVAEAEAAGVTGGTTAAALAAAKAEAEGAVAAATAALGLGLGPSGLCIRLPPDAATAAPPSAIADQLDEQVVAAGGVATMVVIPTDASLPLREESVPARGCLLARVADLLAAASPHHVMQWGRVGHKASYMADPRVGRAPAAAGGGAAAGHTESWEQAVATLSFAPGGNLNALPPFTAPQPKTASATGAASDGGGRLRDEDLAPAESEAASAQVPPPRPSRPAAAAAAAGAPDQEGPVSSSAGAAGVAAAAHPHPHRCHAHHRAPAISPTASEQSISLPPTASVVTTAAGSTVAAPQGAVLEPRPSAAGGGGVAAGAPVQPPASLAAYRAESTLTLAVHRGAAAMDWEPDSQNEVRGPEHAPPPTAAANNDNNDNNNNKDRPFGRRNADSATIAAKQPMAPEPVATAPAAAATAPVMVTAAVTAAVPPGLPKMATHPPTAGPAVASGGPASGAASPLHNTVHPCLANLPEPSLYSKLLLPQLVLAPAVSAAAAEPPPLAAATAAAAAEPLPPSHGGERLNVRATWLAGRPVYGDAVVTTCRQSPTPHIRKNHHVMKWRDYGPRDFWRTATAATSAAGYTRATHAPVLLGGLPAEYRGPASWQGPAPRQLLDAYVAAHPPAASASLELLVPDVDTPGEGLAQLYGTNFMGVPYMVSAGLGPLEVAAQQAALAALLELQRLDAAALAGRELLPGDTAAAAAAAETAAVDSGPVDTRPVAKAVGAVAAPAGAVEAEGESQAGMEPVEEEVEARAEAQGRLGLGVEAAEAEAEAGAQEGREEEEEEEEVADVEVVEPGVAHARQPQEGALAKIAYTIYLSPPDRTARASETSIGAGFEAGNAPGGLVLEQHQGLTICVGPCGAPAVPPAVDAAVRRLRVGGRARCRLRVALDGPDPLSAGFPALPAICELRLLHATLPLVDGRPVGAGAGGGGGPSLFNPPLGQQRMQAVAAVLRREGVRTLVDLGCGECKLIEGLVVGQQGADCGGPLRRAVGVDISRSALVAAGRRLGKLTAAAEEVERLPLNGEEVAPQPVEVTLYCGSAMSPQVAEAAAAGVGAGAGGSGSSPEGGPDPWVGLRGCDAASLVEVVEHLDPEPLALVGPCVLGSLRPRLLIVTTPNWDYNDVMRSCERVAAAAAAAAAAHRKGPGGAGGTSPSFPAPAPPPGGSWPGPPGRDGLPLRCADHRFEWSRGEFWSWCGQLAEEWGYSVSYQEIGRANNEVAALQDPGYTGPQEPGGATQMAVFRRMEQEQPQPQPQPGGAAGSQPAVPAAASVGEEIGAGIGGGGGGGGGDGGGGGGTHAATLGWQLVWGPARVAAPREELEEAEAEVEARGAAATAACGEGGEGGGGGVLHPRASAAPAKRANDTPLLAAAADAAAGRVGTHGHGPRPSKRQAVPSSGACTATPSRPPADRGTHPGGPSAPNAATAGVRGDAPGGAGDGDGGGGGDDDGGGWGGGAGNEEGPSGAGETARQQEQQGGWGEGGAAADCEEDVF